MTKEYGTEKAKRVFYATANKRKSSRYKKIKRVLASK